MHHLLLLGQGSFHLKKDFLTSMVTVLRAVERHKPAVLIGDGQGALVVMGLSRPVLLETALAAPMVCIQAPHGTSQDASRSRGPSFA